MASFKPVVLRRKKNGEWKVYIRVTHNRKTVHIDTGLTAVDGEVRRGVLVGSMVLDQANEAAKAMRERVNAYGSAVIDMDIEDVKAVATRRDEFDRNFFSYCGEHLNRLGSDGRDGTRKSHKTAIQSLRAFVGKDMLYYSDMTVTLMIHYKAYLKNTYGAITSSTYLGIIAMIFRKARAEINGGSVGSLITNDPFEVVKPDKPTATKKRALDPSDIIKVRDAEDTSYAVNRSRDLFMLSFYLVGINAADLYELEKPVDGYITYNRRKTRRRRTDGAMMRLKVPDEALPILEKYADRYGERALDFYNQFGSCYAFSSAVAHGFRRLSKVTGIPDLTFYAARHSWATLAANVCGVDFYTVEKALCHSTAGGAVTETYIRPDYSRIDNANRLVLDVIEEAGL